MIARHIATLGPVGHLRPAPGTWGSAASVLLGLLLAWIGGPYLFILLTLAALPLGIWATAEATRGQDNHDPSEIVIDELLGQWIALWPVVIGAAHVGADLLALWPGILTAFVAFRFFDITKFGPIGWADRRSDALGVMLDDAFAGIAAAVVTVAFAALAHLVLV
ncbi:phosphatidylglycerophosphatase A [Alphaproteobacteria bacterium KMM 3653]|uniref:Phosphatidylglycerophosphatase A n=1 Tax=Harenicola maris TaxID=2841044 RepID=A0AAP2CM73_9RHOB|nr:phosphatidylglycerophosphatase A [Harenicola maris]